VTATWTNRARAGLVGVAIVLGLSGCLRFTSALDVHENNTVSGQYVVAVVTGTGEQAATTDRELAEELWADTGLASALPDAVVADYSADGYTGIVVTFTDAPLAAFAPTSERWGVTRQADEFVVSGKVSAGGALPSDAEGEGGGVDGAPDPDVRVELTFPGPVTESNGQASGRTVRWEITTDETELSARAAATPLPDRSTTFAFLVLGIVAVTALAYWLAGAVGRSMRGHNRGSGTIRS
jgi:hypothetical protein